MFNRECVILTIESKAILWYRGIVLYGSIGLPQAKFTNALTLGAICVRQSAYRSNDGALPLHPRRKRDTALLRGEQTAQELQLSIQYAPDPRFNSGPPDSAAAGA